MTVVTAARGCSWKVALVLCALVFVLCSILQSSWSVLNAGYSQATGFGAGAGGQELVLRLRAKELPIAEVTRELLLNQLSSPHMSEYMHNVRSTLNHTLQRGLEPFDLVRQRGGKGKGG